MYRLIFWPIVPPQAQACHHGVCDAYSSRKDSEKRVNNHHQHRIWDDGGVHCLAMAGEGVSSHFPFSQLRAYLTPLSAKPKGKHSHIFSANVNLSMHELLRLFKVRLLTSSLCLLHTLTLCEDTPSNKIVSDLDDINDVDIKLTIPPEILCEGVLHPTGADVRQDCISTFGWSPTWRESHRPGCCYLHLHSSWYYFSLMEKHSICYWHLYPACTYPMLPPRYRSWKCSLSPILQAWGEAMDERNLGRTRTHWSFLLGIQRGYYSVSHSVWNRGFAFDDVYLGRFLALEEKIVTDYKFGVYDLLVLPPSFPYGGMVSYMTQTVWQ